MSYYIQHQHKSSFTNFRNFIVSNLNSTLTKDEVRFTNETFPNRESVINYIYKGILSKNGIKK